MKYLLFLSIWLFIATSCTPSLTKGFHKEGKQLVRKEQLLPLVKTSQLSKYSMTLDFRDRHFNGLLLIKQTENKSYRIVLSTHFGLSIFDFELTPDTFVIHHCAEPLQKKKLLNLLRKDFAHLLGLNLKEENTAILYAGSRENNQKQIYHLKRKPGKGYYLTDTASSEILQIKTGRGLGKVLINATPSQGKLQISHPMLRLTMELSLL